MSRIYLSPPDVGQQERDAIVAAIDSNWVAPIGPDLDAFEAEVAERANRPYGVGLSSGTAALHLALILAGVGPGDEVIVPTLTFVPTANVATYVGAKPVFIDVELDSWCLSPELVAEFLEKRARVGKIPKAAMVVDLYGQCADYGRLLPIFAKYGVTVIEDAAEALGAHRDGLPAGSHGQFAVFSFNGNKIITTSSGGMLLCNSPDEAARARKLATQAREPFPYYEHVELGYNYRLSNLLAAFGRVQLADLDSRIKRRFAISEIYAAQLREIDGLTFMPIPEGSEPNHWLTCVRFDQKVTKVNPELLRLALEAEDIESRPIWKPLHTMPLFAGCEAILDGSAEAIFNDGLCLPSGSSLKVSELERITDIILQAAKR